jgi:hypothetical protein
MEVKFEHGSSGKSTDGGFYIGIGGGGGGL